MREIFTQLMWEKIFRFAQYDGKLCNLRNNRHSEPLCGEESV